MSAQAPAAGALSSRARSLTLIATILGSTIVFVDSTVVNVALPALASDLDATLAEQQWVVESYLLMLGSLVLVGGSLGDLLGRRRIFALGVGGFGVTSLLCAIAPSAPFLIGARTLQGVAGALLVPSSLAIVTAIYDGPERARAIGTWTAGTSAAIAVGPPLGGLLVDQADWRWVFALNIPFVIGALLITARTMPALGGDRSRHVDVLGGVLCALALAGPVWALIEQPRHGWGALIVWVPLVAGLVVMAVFVRHERRAPDPMVPASLFASRAFTVTNVVTLAVYAGLGSATFFVALFLQQVGGYSALQGGLSLMPITFFLLFLSGRWGALAGRIGSRPLMTAGPLVAAVGLALFLRVDAHADYVSDVLPSVLLFGLGLSMTVAPLTATAMAAAPHELAGTASGFNNAVARIAGLLAIAVVGAVVASVFASDLDRRLAGVRLDAPARTAVADARRRPLALADVSRTSSVARPVEHAQVAASVYAFHRGMLASAVLVAAGGLLALFFLPAGVVSAQESRDARES